MTTSDGYPETFIELCDYIVNNADKIEVRAQIGSNWGSYFLTELPSKEAIRESLNFVKQMRIPVVMKEKETSK